MVEGHPRRRSLVLCGALGLFGAGLFGLSAFEIGSFANAVANRAPIIMWDEGAWLALPAALALLALALALFIGRNHRPDADGPRSGAIRRLLILSVWLLGCVLVFPAGAHWLAGRHLAARGYTLCSERFWIAPDRLPDPAAARARCEEWRQS